ncbi:hypothetical protein KHA93_22055 [Bacillus sp. FJAT-49732]|uniref:Uncharacterized protein n=1 Tax=Lederbergia citrisecunda TaxID=2833583 RepID=A0A942TRA9_9BACI|nr:hypothetical protein [Lederbergia citrisecunda]MBS4202300.1 hypothetical protein [Lederbergia citrisecunda]
MRFVQQEADIGQKPIIFMWFVHQEADIGHNSKMFMKFEADFGQSFKITEFLPTYYSLILKKPWNAYELPKAFPFIYSFFVGRYHS